MSRWVSRLKLQTAVAEFGIVVLGILIALGIDQAVERRGERRLEGEYLASLLADIEQDLSTLDSFYFPFIARRDTAARWLDTFAKVPTLSISDSVKFLVTSTWPPPTRPSIRGEAHSKIYRARGTFA